jgi:hypothetical protein
MEVELETFVEEEEE